MRRDNARGGGGVSGVLGGRGRDLGYGDGGGVGRKNGVRRTYLGKRAEDVELERRDLGHGFDDKVDV